MSKPHEESCSPRPRPDDQKSTEVSSAAAAAAAAVVAANSSNSSSISISSSLSNPLADLLDTFDTDERNKNKNKNNNKSNSFAELRDALLDIAPLNTSHISQINIAEAKYWAQAAGERIGDSTEILGFDCGGQQMVIKPYFILHTSLLIIFLFFSFFFFFFLIIMNFFFTFRFWKFVFL